MSALMVDRKKSLVAMLVLGVVLLLPALPAGPARSKGGFAGELYVLRDAGLEVDPGPRGPQLEHYERPKIAGNRHVLWRACWYLINACLFQGAVLGLIPSAWKAARS